MATSNQVRVGIVSAEDLSTSLTMEAISVRELSKGYSSRDGTVNALQQITFSVSEGEFVAIVGPSGCGKSTLLKILAGLLPSSGGKGAGQRDVAG
jgi:NitT/TauT family transport system ATP-binding protein